MADGQGASKETGSDVARMSGVAFAWPGVRGFRLTVDEFALARGSSTLLIGPSGGGKSTLLGLLCGMVMPREGRIEILGVDVCRLGDAARDRFRAEHVGVIFQMFNLLPYGDLIDNVTLPLSFAASRRRRVLSAGSERAEAERLLSELDIGREMLHDRAFELSVGQQQRVAAARALIGAPELIVADEPTSALDPAREDRFLQLLFEQTEAAGSTLVMASHNEALAPRFDRALRLDEIVTQREGER